MVQTIRRESSLIVSIEPGYQVCELISSNKYRHQRIDFLLKCE